MNNLLLSIGYYATCKYLFFAAITFAVIIQVVPQNKMPFEKQKVILGVGKIFVFGVVVIIGSWLYNVVFGPPSPQEQKENRKVMAWVMGEEAVKAQLKAPATAKFPAMVAGNFISELDSNTYIINGYVDAQNSFGANMRAYFFCEVQYKGGDIDSTQNWEIMNCYLKQ